MRESLEMNKYMLLYYFYNKQMHFITILHHRDKSEYLLQQKFHKTQNKRKCSPKLIRYCFIFHPCYLKITVAVLE